MSSEAALAGVGRRPGPNKVDTPGAVRQWLREHPGEPAFTTQEIKDAFPGRGLSTTAISAELRKSMGSYPTLARTSKSAWTLSPAKAPRDGEYRITRDTPLRAGARLEVVGLTGAGVAVARDPGGRLWVLAPLELPA